MASDRGKFSAVVFHRSPRSRWVWLLFVLWLTALIPELALHLATAKDPASLWNYGMYLPGLFALVPALILFAVLCLIHSGGWKRALLILFSLIVFVLCASQLVYYRIFGCFYSAYSMANGGQAVLGYRTENRLAESSRFDSDAAAVSVRLYFWKAPDSAHRHRKEAPVSDFSFYCCGSANRSGAVSAPVRRKIGAEPI